MHLQHLEMHETHCFNSSFSSSSSYPGYGLCCYCCCSTCFMLPRPVEPQPSSISLSRAAGITNSSKFLVLPLHQPVFLFPSFDGVTFIQESGTTTPPTAQPFHQLHGPIEAIQTTTGGGVTPRCCCWCSYSCCCCKATLRQVLLL